MLVPTRELAMQVSEAMFKYGRQRGTVVVPVYGGQPIGRQLQALDRGVHVVVGTPGRVLDHLKRGSLVADTVDVVVLDEADEMLDMGFAEDLEAILAATPDDRQTVLFSATMPPRIEKIAREFQRDPLRLTVTAKPTAGTDVRVTQRLPGTRRHKPAALGRILDIEAGRSAGVLPHAHRGRRADRDDERPRLPGRSTARRDGPGTARSRDAPLARRHLGAADRHRRGRPRPRRRPAHPRRQLRRAVVTGNLRAPHRACRTGRREGVAITLAEPRERRLLANIERFTGARITLSDVPSIAELRARQAESTVAAVIEAIDSGDLDDYTEMFNALTVESPHTYADVTRAALKLVHQLRGNDTDETEIPTIVERPERRDRNGRGDDRDQRAAATTIGSVITAAAPTTRRRPRREPNRADDGRTGFVYVNLGRNAGVRPADLVGAVAGETGLRGRRSARSASATTRRWSASPSTVSTR